MPYNVITMDQAIASGVSRRQVYRLVEQGKWVRLSEGVFVTASPLPEQQALRWRTELAGVLLRHEGRAMISHQAAAILHGMEGVKGFPIQASVPSSVRWSKPGIHRTAFVDPAPVMIDGLLATSVARTLLDLGNGCPASVVEQALESVLRGSDPKRPDIWNEALLAQLRELVVVHERRPGAFVLRSVLALRSDTDRPTGSFPETLVVQSLREVGISFVRQPTVRIFDRNGVLLHTYFADIGIEMFGGLVEVDGAEAHASAAALAHDLRRQNALLPAFRLLRYPAGDVLRDPVGVALDIQRQLSQVPVVGNSWTKDGMTVRYSTNEFIVVDSTRDARAEAQQRRRAG